MRSVNLKINPFERFSSFKIDNESISPYSQLANYARQDSLLWLKNMFPSIDQQVYDLYNLTVTASSFELFLIARLYNAKAQANPLCKRIISENYDLGLTIEERYNWISAKEALIFGSDKEKYKIPIYENGYIQYDRNFFYKSTLTDAKVIIIRHENEIYDMSIPRNKPRIILKVCNGTNASYSDALNGYVIEVKETELNYVINSIVEKFYKIPLIITAKSVLYQYKNQFSENDKLMYDVLTSIDAIVRINDIPLLEVGQSYRISYDTTPPNKNVEIRVVSSNSDCVSVNGLDLLARSEGRTILHFYKNNESTPFQQKSVSCYEKTYIKDIKLYIDCEAETGRNIQIEYDVEPKNATDIDEIEWFVNSEYATISNTGVLNVFKGGKVTVTAKSKKVEAKLTINVASVINKIILDIDNKVIEAGRTERMIVKTLPDNLNREYSCYSSNEDIAIVEDVNDGTHLIRGLSIGECDITVKSKKGDVKEMVHITIKGIEKQSYTLLSLQAFLVFLSFILLGLGQGIIVQFCSVVVVILGIAALIAKKKEKVWSIVLMIIAIILFVCMLM